MPHLNRAVATLRVVGLDLDPEQVSVLLGSSPSHSASKGQTVISPHGLAPRVARNGVWQLEAAATEPEDFDFQVAQLLGDLTKDIEVWRGLANRYKLDIFCGWFMKESNEGVDIKSSTLEDLGRRGIALALDIYAPDRDA